MKRLGNIINEAFAEAGWEDAVAMHQALIEWPEAVGERFAKHCQAVDVRGETLWVRAKSAAWKSELLFHKNTVLEALNSRLDKHQIKDIRFVI